MFTMGRLSPLAAAMLAATAALYGQDGVPFRAGVALINVTATVTDEEGRFVEGLRQDDFAVYEDGVRQDISHFSSERVPVSLGIVLDTSGSMTDEKMSAARAAINRFVHDLLGPDDELFFMQFATRPDLIQGWTTDRQRISRAVARIGGQGGTAMYDAVAEALPLASAGNNRKKALLVISDGNDTGSDTSPAALRRLIRESEVIVYALGIDGTAPTPRRQPIIRRPPPVPFPIPGRRPGAPRGFPPFVLPQRGGWTSPGATRVDADALRQMTDDTGGRTEIVRDARDLDGATARIADELSRQYFLGYAGTGTRDGQWHAIRLEVRDRRLQVRARRGYIAS